MKTKNILLCIAALFALSSCSKDYLDINTSPNKPTTVVPGLVLTNALSSTANNTTGSINFYQFASTWTGSWNYSGAVAAFAEERSYQFTTNYGPAVGIWNGLYNNLEDYDYVEKQGATTKNSFYVAVAKTIKAYDFQYLVDVFGNIPYNQALKSTVSIRPQYDKDQAIYEDLAKQLDTAATLFKGLVGKVNSSDAAFDIMYKGDAQKWGKFANTLKLRLLLRQSEIAGRSTYISNEIAKITANGLGYIGAGDGGSVNPGYSNSAGKQNPYWATFGYSPLGKSAPTDNHRYCIASHMQLIFIKITMTPV
jgi:hypothetical protein